MYGLEFNFLSHQMLIFVPKATRLLGWAIIGLISCTVV